MSENNNSFHYTYSAQEQAEIEAIRKKYVVDTPSAEADKMEQLRRLDAGVTNKAMGVSLTVGILSTLLMGLGMSLIMTELGDVLPIELKWGLGLSCGILGIVGVIAAWPLYQGVLRKEQKKIAPQILKLTDELTRK